MTPDWLDAFDAWFQTNETRLAGAGLRLGQLGRVPLDPDTGSEPTISADVWARTHVGRATLRQGGCCELAVLDAHSGGVLLTSEVSITSPEHLAHTLEQFCTAVQSGQLPRDADWSLS